MRIRPATMYQLSDAGHRRLSRQIASVLRSEFKEDVERFDDESLLKLVDAGCSRARAYGLKLDDDIRAFVCLLFVIGWKFDGYPPFAAVLTEPLYRPEQRMPYLFESASPEDWDLAAEWSRRATGAAGESAEGSSAASSRESGVRL